MDWAPSDLQAPALTDNRVASWVTRPPLSRPPCSPLLGHGSSRSLSPTLHALGSPHSWTGPYPSCFQDSAQISRSLGSPPSPGLCAHLHAPVTSWAQLSGDTYYHACSLGHLSAPSSRIQAHGGQSLALPFGFPQSRTLPVYSNHLHIVLNRRFRQILSEFPFSCSTWNSFK